MQLREVISTEWDEIRRTEAETATKIRASKETQSVERLYTVATRLRDVLFGLQRDAFAAFNDRSVFERVRRSTAGEVRTIAESFRGDARLIGAEAELDALRAMTHDALVDLPFPEELSIDPEAARRRAAGISRDAVDMFFRGGNPMRAVQSAASDEAAGRLSSLRDRYSEWWQRHCPKLQQATAALQDALTAAVIRIASEQLRRI
jgi:hypothetical protein